MAKGNPSPLAPLASEGGFYCHSKPQPVGSCVYRTPMSLRGTKCRGNLLSVGSCIYRPPMSLRGTKCRGNLLSVGSCIYRTPMSLRASDRCHWRGNPYPLSPCHCEAGIARRGNLLSVGCCIHRKLMSLRASPQTGVAIRFPYSMLHSQTCYKRSTDCHGRSAPSQ